MTNIRLITVGLDRYPKESHWDVPQAASSRATVEQLFRQHGIHVRDWTEHATTSKIGKRLAKWKNSTGISHVLYWIGHGEYSGHGYHLALFDSKAPLDSENALAGVRLRAALRDHVAHRGDAPEWLLLILDTCGSFDGLDEIYSELKRPDNLGIVATTGRGAAHAGTFASNLALVLDGFTGNDTAGIPLKELVRRLDDAGHETQARFSESARIPSRLDSPPPAQASLDNYAELAAVLSDATPEMRNHFYAKAQGAEINEPAWYFTGRVKERRALAAWLRDATDGMFVVSGVAGSGKSALLGMMLATSDDTVIAALEHAGHESIPRDLRPDDLRFDAVVHLRGLTTAEAVAALGTSLGFEGVEGPEELVAHVRKRPDASRLTVLVDALDESRDPLTIASVLRMLALAPLTRVLVGTRQSIHEDPDQLAPPDYYLLNILAANPPYVIRLQREPDAVREYVTQRLRRLSWPVGADQAVAIAQTIAECPQPFLFARLAVHEILADREWIASQAALSELLSAGHQGIFGRAVQRLRASDPEVEALLHALTYARGNGFPRTGGTWALAASALTGSNVTDLAVTRATKIAAAPYIMIDTEFGQSVYRLAHRTFVDWYRRQNNLT